MFHVTPVSAPVPVPVPVPAFVEHQDNESAGHGTSSIVGYKYECLNARDLINKIPVSKSLRKNTTRLPRNHHSSPDAVELFFLCRVNADVKIELYQGLTDNEAHGKVTQYVDWVCRKVFRGRFSDGMDSTSLNSTNSNDQSHFANPELANSDSDCFTDAIMTGVAAINISDTRDTDNNMNPSNSPNSANNVPVSPSASIAIDVGAPIAPNYNNQDFIEDVLFVLQDDGIIDENEAGYRLRKYQLLERKDVSLVGLMEDMNFDHLMLASP